MDAADDPASHLARLAGAADLPSRIDAFTALLAWTRHGSDAPEAALAPGQTARVADRHAGLALALQSDPALRRQVAAAVSAIIAEADGTNLFGVAGIPHERSFLAEASDRLLARILPRPRDDHDLARILRRLFPSEAAVRRFERLPEASFRALVDGLAGTDWTPLRRAFADGFRLLAVRVAGHGLEPRLRETAGTVPVGDDPFLRQQRSSEALLRAWTEGADTALAAAGWRDDAQGCRTRLAAVRAHLEREGVNVDLVFALDVIERCLCCDLSLRRSGKRSDDCMVAR